MEDLDAEFFQDLMQWCDLPTEQVVVQSIGECSYDSIPLLLMTMTNDL